MKTRDAGYFFRGPAPSDNAKVEHPKSLCGMAPNLAEPQDPDVYTPRVEGFDRLPHRLSLLPFVGWQQSMMAQQIENHVLSHLDSDSQTADSRYRHSLW